MTRFCITCGAEHCPLAPDRHGDERVRAAKLAARIRMMLIGEDPASTLGILLTALQIVGGEFGLSRADLAELVGAEPETALSTAAAADGRPS
jgi:hypothetical protein